MTKRVLVVHSAECGETDTAAEGVARYLQGRRLPVHYTVDANSHVQMLALTADCRAARGLPPADGIHIEHAGRASQTPAEWADPYSDAMLGRSAILAAKACIQFNIPPVHLTGPAVKNGRGIVGHHDITVAYNVKGGHTDPGVNFPWRHWLDMIAINMLALRPPAPPAAPTPPPPPPAPVPGPDIVAVLKYLALLLFSMKVKAAGGATWHEGSGTVEEVKVIQAGLQKAGHTISVDGSYGPATKREVVIFQSWRRMPADGVVGIDTLNALYPG